MFFEEHAEFFKPVLYCIIMHYIAPALKKEQFSSGSDFKLTKFKLSDFLSSDCCNPSFNIFPAIVHFRIPKPEM